jgi:uncharacterized RDD family membrane protein YckC
VPPPALGPGGQPLAQFGDRLLAYIIDVALLTVVAMVVAVPVFLVVFANLVSRIETTDPYAEPDPSVVMTEFFLPLLLVEAGLFLLVLVLYYIYDVEMMYRSGQTLGKKIMKLRIVPLDPAATLTRGAAAKRYGVQYLAGSLLPFFSYVDGLWQLWDKPYQQALHDKAAGTIVIKVSA